MKNIKLLIIGLIISCSLYSHNVDCPEITLKEWNVRGKTFQGSFLIYRNDTVFIEKANHEIVSLPHSKFTVTDRKFLDKKILH